LQLSSSNLEDPPERGFSFACPVQAAHEAVAPAMHLLAIARIYLPASAGSMVRA